MASVKEDVESWRNCLLEIKAGYEVSSGKRLGYLPFLYNFFVAFVYRPVSLCRDDRDTNFTVLFVAWKDAHIIKEAAQNVIMADALKQR